MVHIESKNDNCKWYTLVMSYFQHCSFCKPVFHYMLTFMHSEIPLCAGSWGLSCHNNRHFFRLTSFHNVAYLQHELYVMTHLFLIRQDLELVHDPFDLSRVKLPTKRLFYIQVFNSQSSSCSCDAMISGYQMYGMKMK